MVSLQRQAAVLLQQNYWSTYRGSDPADPMFCILLYLLYLTSIPEILSQSIPLLIQLLQLNPSLLFQSI